MFVSFIWPENPWSHGAPKRVKESEGNPCISGGSSYGCFSHCIYISKDWLEAHLVGGGLVKIVDFFSIH